MEKYNTLTGKKDYELFLSSIPAYMQELADKIQKKELSFDDEETAIVSRYFIQLRNDGLYSLDDKKKFIAYIGEAFMKRYGGEWFFTGTKKDSFAINEPVIIKFKDESIRKSPSEEIYSIFEDNDEYSFVKSMKYSEEMSKKIDDFFDEFFPKKKKKK
jgi:hypothetical protein